MGRSKILATMLVLVGLVMVMTVGFSAFADIAAPAAQTLSFSNPVSSTLSLDHNSINFDPIVPGTPKPIEDAATVTGGSNALWTLTLTSTNFTNGSNNISRDCLGIRVNATEGNYTAIAPSGTALTSSHAAGSAAFTMDYELTIPTDAPGAAGTYQATLTYTMS